MMKMIIINGHELTTVILTEYLFDIFNEYTFQLIFRALSVCITYRGGKDPFRRVLLLWH